MRTVLSLVVASLVSLSPALAQDYPNRAITLVSPFPPGGPSDTSARMVVGPMAQARRYLFR